ISRFLASGALDAGRPLASPNVV
ncbi:MAG: hypothetical protein JWM93_1441, partial [Frankiales bacterium]|nr:hypothetical protein [Frankiales bacterium]